MKVYKHKKDKVRKKVKRKPKRKWLPDKQYKAVQKWKLMLRSLENRHY